MYSKLKLDSYYFKIKSFYAFFIPLGVPYKEIYKITDKSKFKRREVHSPILESARMFGIGWIGVEIEKPTMVPDNVFNLKGEFEVYEHRGPYKTIGKAYKKIMKERPVAREFFNLYFDDPEKVLPEACRTQILFR